MQSTHQAREPSHIGIQALGPLQPGSHLELQTQRDRLWLLHGLTGIKWTEGSRCQPATGSKRLLAMLCCGLSEVFWTLLDPKGSEVLALWPLPQGGTATLPPLQLSHLHAAQQGPWQLCSGQGQAPPGAGQAACCAEQGLYLSCPTVGTCPPHHTLLLAPCGQEGTCCCMQNSSICLPAAHSHSTAFCSSPLPTGIERPQTALPESTS